MLRASRGAASRRRLASVTLSAATPMIRLQPSQRGVFVPPAERSVPLDSRAWRIPSQKLALQRLWPPPSSTEHAPFGAPAMPLQLPNGDLPRGYF